MKREIDGGIEVCVLWAGDGDEGAFRWLWCTARKKKTSIRERSSK